MTWAIVAHGGASRLEEDRDAFESGVRAAVEAGAAVLQEGGSAVDAAVAAVRVLETDPTFNAGIGAARNADGRVQCDAAVMDGSTL
ncbi:MAG TPA: isoaspartyl peptidase/L-asparaginase, partial [Rhodoglobus sp.]|nr:isoaspartyl peptidase/L-asparaginase [Rhodoglobus sp.]